MTPTIPTDCTSPVETVSFRAPKVPSDLAHYASLATARGVVTRKLAGLEIPMAFQLSTIAAADNAFSRNTVSAKAARRRLLDKATKLASVEAQS
jgi:hypothetical protein